MKKKVSISILLVLLVGFLALGVLRLNQDRIRDGYHPRDHLLRQSLWALVSCLIISQEKGVLAISEKDYGENLNSNLLRLKLGGNSGCDMFFMPIDSTEEEQNKWPDRSIILFDDLQGKYVDEIGNPVYLIYFGESSYGYGNKELDLLARRYRAVGWVVGKDGINRYGRSSDGFFVGYTRDGEREYQRRESSW